MNIQLADFYNMKNKSVLACGFMYLTCVLVCNAQNNSTNVIPLPKSYMQAVRFSVDSLFAWPDQEVLNGPKQIRANAPEIAYAKTQCLEWIKTALDTAWCPSTNTEIHFLKKEFADHDVVRMAWNSHGFRMEVSQTHSLFAIKLMPQNQQFFGDGIIQKMHAVKDMSIQIFNKNGTFYDSRKGQIEPETLTNLTGLVESWSFVSDQVKTTTEGMVYRELQPGKERYKPESVETPWKMTVESHEYWFRNIYWWNNGSQIGFYFPKSKGYGARAVAFAGFLYDDSFDKNFFRLLK